MLVSGRVPIALRSHNLCNSFQAHPLGVFFSHLTKITNIDPMCFGNSATIHSCRYAANKKGTSEIFFNSDLVAK